MRNFQGNVVCPTSPYILFAKVSLTLARSLISQEAYIQLTQDLKEF